MKKHGVYPFMIHRGRLRHRRAVTCHRCPAVGTVQDLGLLGLHAEE
jgi:hypothetical protein